MSTPIYILGGSQTDFSRNWSREGLKIFDMFSETLNDALTNAKLTPDQIQVAHVGNFVGDLFTGQGLINGFLVKFIPKCPPFRLVGMRLLAPQARLPY